MKNPYTKIVKHLEKQSMFMQYVDDAVYLTDGKVVLKVPKAEYDIMIKPLSGILPEVKEECKGKKTGDMRIVEVSPDGFDIKEAVEKIKAKAVIKQTPVSIDLPLVSKKKARGRVFKSDSGAIIVVNEEYLEMAEGFISGTSWQGEGKWNTPLFQISNSGNYMFIVFPMKVDNLDEILKF